MEKSYRQKSPVSPGVFIKEDILDEFGLTQDALAKRLGVSRRAVNEIINERRSVSAEMSLRLAKLTGTSAEFWLNLQNNVDIAKAISSIRSELERIKPLQPDDSSANHTIF
jgi:addiction module HigA family antidote